MVERRQCVQEAHSGGKNVNIVTNRGFYCLAAVSDFIVSLLTLLEQAFPLFVYVLLEVFDHMLATGLKHMAETTLGL